MLSDYPVTATIPVTDIEKSRDFYENKLGLKPSDMDTAGGMLLDAGNGTSLFLYQREPSKADHTLASFNVNNLEDVMDELSQKGVKFEQYDMPNGIKTDAKGIVTMGGAKSAWFKDPDGNIFGIVQMKK